MRLSTPHGHDFFNYHGFHSFFERHHAYDESGLHRGWLAAVGVLYLALGIVGLGYLSLATIVSVLFFGVLAWFGGVVQFVQSFTSHGWKNITAGAAMGILYVLAGAVIFYNPILSTLFLTLILAGSLIGLGIVRIAFSINHRTNRYWIWSVASGVISMALGFLIMAQWPFTGLWVIGLFVCLEMVFHGAAALALSLENRKLSV